MKLFALITALFLGVAVSSVGCDDVRHEEKTTRTNDDGTVTKEHKKVTENDEGDKTVTHEKSVDRP